jgi:hypothetical protein
MYLDDEHFFVELYRNINHILSIASAKNIKVYFSSWDDLTYNHLIKYLGKDNKMLLPYFNDNRITLSHARDGKHSGGELHKNFADKVIGVLNEN